MPKIWFYLSSRPECRNTTSFFSPYLWAAVSCQPPDNAFNNYLLYKVIVSLYLFYRLDYAILDTVDWFSPPTT